MFQMYHSRIKLLILPFLLLAFVCVPKVNALVEINGYVNDYANIISSNDEEYIIQKSKELNGADGTQIVVVTVPSLDGMPIEDYALELGRKYGLGDSDKNNGLLILIALSERKSRIEVGYGLEGILPDGKTGRIQDEYMIPHFKNGDYSKGIIDGYDVIFSTIVKEHDLNLEYREVKSSDEIEGILALAGICGIAFGLIIARKSKWRFASLLIMPFVSLLVISYFVSIFTFVAGVVLGVLATKAKFTNIYIGSGGSRGGFSGGGFSGGGFSGGGGSFGGGGSTRGW